MWLLFRDIITKRFCTYATSSTRFIIVSINSSHLCRIRTLLCLLTLLVVTSTYVQGINEADHVIIPRVHSWRRSRYNNRFLGSTESLYLGYSGNPWGTSSPIVYHNDYETRLFWKKRNIIGSPKNDSKNTKTPMTSRVNSSLRRSKRGVIHLYNMLFCATGCNPLAYKGYGCYCGFLGSGFTIDGIDRCCKMHDWCYEATDCPMFSEYFVPYYWKCYRGNRPICAVEHGDWGGSGSCAQRLCECDRALAECLRRYPCPTTKAVCTSSPWRLVQNLFMLL